MEGEEHAAAPRRPPRPAGPRRAPDAEGEEDSDLLRWLAGWEEWQESPDGGRDAQGQGGAAAAGEGAGDDAEEEGEDPAEAGAAGVYTGMGRMADRQTNIARNKPAPLQWDQVIMRARLDIKEYIGDHAKLDGGTGVSHPPTVRRCPLVFHPSHPGPIIQSISAFLSAAAAALLLGKLLLSML